MLLYRMFRVAEYIFFIYFIAVTEWKNPYDRLICVITVTLPIAQALHQYL
jgi:hypothetical protein